MAVIISVILALFAIGVVVFPFIKGRLRLQTAQSQSSTGPDARRDREAIYDDIKTLQLEYELGSIEGKDYHERLRAHRLDAAMALRDQERQELELDSLLEEEISHARGPRDSIRDSLRCRTCGRPMAPIDTACPHCDEERREGDVNPGS